MVEQFNFYNPTPMTTSDNERQKAELEEKAELSKFLGSYIISSTEICYSKCVNSGDHYFSSLEQKCLKNCVNGLTNLNAHLIKKMYKKCWEKDYTDYLAIDYFDKKDVINLIKSKIL